MTESIEQPLRHDKFLTPFQTRKSLVIAFLLQQCLTKEEMGLHQVCVKLYSTATITNGLSPFL